MVGAGGLYFGGVFSDSGSVFSTVGRDKKGLRLVAWRDARMRLTRWRVCSSEWS